MAQLSICIGFTMRQNSVRGNRHLAVQTRGIQNLITALVKAGREKKTNVRRHVNKKTKGRMILNSIFRFPGFQQQQISIGLPSFNNTNRSTSVNAKPGRGRLTGSGTGSRRGNRGSQIRAVPVSGEGVTRNSYTTAYCYQSMYYALKPNSSPPEYYFISKGKLPSQYSTTIELQKAPVVAKC
ncbi:hypothetical protein DAPPUDRAFT_123594 [Daphnia pulex]|uniref:Uncharacterized protein n=1 Tax=Daphnia pulex TaxID=6669 RepID=E9I5Y3_DAPPU|nr:hypothetical protein DAPPUDRAFT_123594 [Daphnia pulex]|eukprot:EFX60597.1 hypothetical protein DAPPUDRAFT_123594 [Daphnia pulex]